MKYSELKSNQVEFVKKLLAIKVTPTDIKSEFRSYYDGANIDGDAIDLIQDLHKDEIREIARKELSNPGAVGMAYSRVRLEFAQKALKIASEYKGRRSYAVTNAQGLTEYKEIMDIDHASAERWLKFCQAEDFLARKLKLEKLSRGVKDTTIDNPLEPAPIVTIHSGYEDEDEILQIEDYGQKQVD